MKERFDTLYAAYTPAADDPAENVPFYAAYAALKALWPGMSEHVIHQCGCAAGWAADGQRYAAALATVRDMAERAQMPREPYRRISYALAPDAVSDGDVTAFVRAEYKRAFPSCRWGSAHAKEQFERVKDQARAILEERRVERVKAYLIEESRIEAENAARKAEYDAEVARVNGFRSAVAALLASDVVAA